MPAPLNLTGRRFGRLVVLGRGSRVKYGTWQWSWLCRCDCGAEIAVPQRRLPVTDRVARIPGRAVTACPVCRGSPCVVCGQNIPLSGRGHGRPATCSPACAEQHRKAQQRASWRRRLARDPELAARMCARRRAKAATDPEYAARMQAWEARRERRRQERLRADPEYAARRRQRARALYARHAERIQAERRARLDALAPGELDAWLERARRYCRDWRRQQLAALKEDPDAYRRYQDIRNEYQRRRHARLAGPPPERHCVVCGTAFVTRQFRVLCARPECHRAYRRNVQARSRERAALAVFLHIEQELTQKLKRMDHDDHRPDTCPDRL